MHPYFQFPEPLINSIETLVLRESGHRRSEDFFKKFAPEIWKLSDLFNQKRGAAPLSSTLASREYPIAYLSYFLPANFFKMGALLLDFRSTHPRHPFFFNEIRDGAPDKPFRVLDLGSGPGTHGLGLLDFCARYPEPFLPNRIIEYLAVDQDPRMLGHLSHLFSEYRLTLAASLKERGIRFVPTTLQRKISQKMALEGEFELIILGNLLNEMVESGHALSSLAEWVRLLVSSLTRDGVLFLIEPALRKTSRNLLELRNRIVSLNAASIIAPCLHQRPCPIMTPDGSEKDWCHQEKEWGAPAWIENIDQIIGMKKDALKYSYLILSRPGEAPHHQPENWRMVSEMMETKGKRDAFLCNETGRIRFYLLGKETSDLNQLFTGLKRGDLISIDRAGSPAGSRILPAWRVRKEIAD